MKYDIVGYVVRFWMILRALLEVEINAGPKCLSFGGGFHFLQTTYG
jgi:hypothetical protein